MFDKFLSYLPTMRKAIVSGAVVLVLSWLSLLGVDGNTTVSDALTAVSNAIVTAALTWLVPNARSKK